MAAKDPVLDERDRVLLRALQRDATLTLQQLAEAAALSPASAWRRIRDLEKAGIVAARVALVDPARIGLKTLVAAHVDLKDHSETTRANFERFIESADEIVQCCSVSGAHDYLLLVRVTDVEAYERFLMDRLLAHASVESAHSSFALRQVKYSTALPL